MEKGNGGQGRREVLFLLLFSTSARNAVCCSQPVRPFSQSALLRHHLYPTGKFLGRYCHSHLALANTETQCVLRGLFAETCKVHFRSLQVTWKILQRHDPRPWEIEIQNLLLLCYYLLHCKPVHLDDCVVTNNF